MLPQNVTINAEKVLNHSTIRKAINQINSTNALALTKNIFLHFSTKKNAIELKNSFLFIYDFKYLHKMRL